MKYLPIFLALLIAAPAASQSLWPASKVVYADADTVEDTRSELLSYAIGSLPTCDADAYGGTVYVTDSSASDCATDGGVDVDWVLCGCTAESAPAWTAVGSGGGGGVHPVNLATDVTGELPGDQVSIADATTRGTMEVADIGQVTTGNAVNLAMTPFNTHHAETGRDGGDVTGPLRELVVADDSHSHTFDFSNLTPGTITPPSTEYYYFGDKAHLATSGTGTITATGLQANAINHVSLIDASFRTGSSGVITLGTAPGFAYCAEWNGSGQLLSSGAPCMAAADYCAIAGCSMTGSISFLDNQGISLGTTNQGHIYYDGTDLTFELDSGLADFLGGITVGSLYNQYSLFGLPPTVLSPSNTVDQLVVRQELGGTDFNFTRALLVINEITTSSNLATTQYGANIFVYTDPAGSINNTKTSLPGAATANRVGFRHQGSGTWGTGGGMLSQAAITGDPVSGEDGTLGLGFAYADMGGDGGANTGVIEDYWGFWVAESTGNVDEKIGLFMESLQNAVVNYGIKMLGASDGAVWFANDNAIDGTIFWGVSKDTNLYRSAINTLKTDDSFVVGTDLTVTGDIHGNTDRKCARVDQALAPGQLDDIWPAHEAVTITGIWCKADAGTVGIDFKIGASAVNGSTINCTSTPEWDQTLSGTTAMAQGDILHLDVISVATAERVLACFDYTVD